jgi:hypothetical protein
VRDRAVVSQHNCGLRIDEGDRPERVGCAASLSFAVEGFGGR